MIKDNIQTLIGSKSHLDRKRVKQIKLLKDLEKSERLGKDVSRGICFVEFDSHDTALKFMKAVKSSPGGTGMCKKKEIPICSFAIDDIRKLQKRLKKLERQKEKNSALLKPKTKEQKKDQKQELNQRRTILCPLSI